MQNQCLIRPHGRKYLYNKSKPLKGWRDPLFCHSLSHKGPWRDSHRQKKAIYKFVSVCLCFTFCLSLNCEIWIWVDIWAERQRLEARHWEPPKMYPPELSLGSTIQSSSAAHREAQDLVFKISKTSERSWDLELWWSAKSIVFSINKKMAMMSIGSIF